MESGKSSDKLLQDQQLTAMEVFIGKSLRYGVMLSGAVLAVGLVLMILAPNNYVPPTGLTGLWQGLKAGRSDAIIQTGLILLVLTPVFRVAASVVLFLRQKDFLYVVITVYVLFILVLSFFLGKAG